LKQPVWLRKLLIWRADTWQDLVDRARQMGGKEFHDCMAYQAYADVINYLSGGKFSWENSEMKNATMSFRALVAYCREHHPNARVVRVPFPGKGDTVIVIVG
jgi:hypothetical protein